MRKKISSSFLILCILVTTLIPKKVMAATGVEVMTTDDKKAYLVEIGTPQAVVDTYSDEQISNLVDRIYESDGNVSYVDCPVLFYTNFLNCNYYVETVSASNTQISKVYINVNYVPQRGGIELGLNDFLTCNWPNAFTYNTGSFVGGGSPATLEYVNQGGIGWTVMSSGLAIKSYAIFELLPVGNKYSNSTSAHSNLNYATVAVEYASSPLPVGLGFKVGEVSVSLDKSFFASYDTTGFTFDYYTK